MNSRRFPTGKSGGKAITGATKLGHEAVNIGENELWAFEALITKVTEQAQP